MLLEYFWSIFGVLLDYYRVLFEYLWTTLWISTFGMFLEYFWTVMEYRVTQKKYSCLIKHKMHNKRGIFKIKIVLNYQ